ncbi:MAG: hypothetical protein P4L84_06835 [Isosphaeraceae bacterium]|nr:hypothetical protein [Isosphaeraceae bacterium]
MTIYNNLDNMILSIDCISLGYIDAYCNGYSWALDINRVEEPSVPPFKYFSGWLGMTQRKISLVRGWPVALLAKARNDEDQAKRAFVKLVSRYRKLCPVPGMSVVLPREQRRTDKYLRWRHDVLKLPPRERTPIPDRIQVILLRPSDICYLRSTYGDQTEDSSLYPDVGMALREVEDEYGISPEQWSIQERGPIVVSHDNVSPDDTQKETAIRVQPNNCYELIRQIKARPSMYFGGRSIEELGVYLAGYTSAMIEYRIVEQGVPPFPLFLDWLALTQKGTWHRGWAETLLSKSKYDHKVALKRFFQLVERFGSLHPVPGTSINLRVGQKRSPDYTQWSGIAKNLPMPDRLQIVQLRPGKTCYLRHWFGERAKDEPPLFANVDMLFAAVDYEFNIGVDVWSAG